MTSNEAEGPEAGTAGGERLTDSARLRRHVKEVVDTTPVIDMHTHLYPPQFGSLSLSGIDHLLTYHYLIAETFRSAPLSPETFWSLSQAQQADLVWHTLFVQNTPLSEATRGLLTLLQAFGLDPAAPDLSEARAFFASRHPAAHLDRVLQLSGVSDLVMTNDPFDPHEARLWERGLEPDARFHAALRLDRLLNDWPETAPKLAAQGYKVDAGFDRATASEVRRFLDKWIARMKPLYLAVSLPDSFSYPAADARSRLIREVVLATAREHHLPLTLMVGVRRGVNPALRAAGDGVGRADVSAVERLCAENPDVRFLATFLSRENQHELCVAARKFANLLPFGCWWFLNNPSIVGEVTRERVEMLGVSFVAQHSDARILEQLIYKWGHTRRVMVEVLSEAYERVLEAGRGVSREEVERDVERLFAGNFRQWVGLPVPSTAGEQGRLEAADVATAYRV